MVHRSCIRISHFVGNSNYSQKCLSVASAISDLCSKGLGSRSNFMIFECDDFKAEKVNLSRHESVRSSKNIRI